MILPVYAYGSTVLRQECKEIEEGTDVAPLLANMFETMYKSSGVGLAAPQVGKSLRVFIIDATPFAENEPENEFEEKGFEKLKNFKRVFINPIIEDETGASWAFSEGCLSIPGIREDITRKSLVKISYFDENWKLHEEEYEGLAGRIIQHEYDHIEGVLFTDLINPLKKRLLKRRLADITKGKVDVKYRMSFPKG